MDSLHGVPRLRSDCQFAVIRSAIYTSLQFRAARQVQRESRTYSGVKPRVRERQSGLLKRRIIGPEGWMVLSARKNTSLLSPLIASPVLTDEVPNWRSTAIPKPVQTRISPRCSNSLSKAVISLANSSNSKLGKVHENISLPQRVE